LKSLPDKVFAEKMVGDGRAIKPFEGTVVSPIDGLVKQIFSTGHAIVLETPEHLSLLIHIGLDTVKLKGRGFEILAKQGERVITGQTLVKFDIDFIKENALSTISPVVLPEMERVIKIEKPTIQWVKKGRDILFKVVLKNTNRNSVL
jgi:PTS system glucose-specific IIA component